MYICVCNAVTHGQVEECVRAGASSLDQLAFELGVGTCCGRCRECAVEILRDACACRTGVAAAE